MVGYTKGTSTFTSYTCNKKSAPSSTTTDFDSSNVKYDNSNNGLTSTTVKAALGDIASYVSKCEQYKHVENETTTSYDCVADVYTATFYYQSNPNNGSSTVSSLTTSCNASTVGTCRADIPTEVRNSVGTYNTPYYGLSASTGSMQYAASKIYTDVTISGDKPFYAIYQGQVTIYYPFGFDTCDSTSYYKNQFLSSTSTMAAPVITGASSGTTNRGFSSYIQYYDFDGFAATDGTNTITYNDVASLADSSAIAGYAVNSKSLTRTFYYSTSVTGTKGNSVLNGTQYLVCNGASVDVIEEGLTPPNSIAPYGTSFLGWGVGPNTMTPSTINPNPTSGNYNFYAIYQSEVTNYYYNNGWASRTLYHNAVYKSETNYSVYLSTSNTGMSNYSTSGVPDSSLWNGLSNDANGTADYSTVAEAALGSDNTLYSLYKYYVYYFAGSHVSSIGANSDNCNAYARDPNNGTPSCYVTLPTITPGTGYYAVGWNTTSGAT
ncbi:MAG: hypothetical protein IKI04_00485, partial [Bacilli bacterium]|nr:hypothetical protein [Bacilli bacterium]